MAIVHSTLAVGSPDAAGAWSAAARLTDRRRIAVLLEGAALLSLLERVGCSLAEGWRHAALTAGGHLVVAPRAVAPGRVPSRAAELLRDLLLRLFDVVAAAPTDSATAGVAVPPTAAPPAGAPPTAAVPSFASSAWTGAEGGGEVIPGSGGLAGRGSARRAARALLAGWWQPLVPPSADEAVAQILAAAPFLWEPAFAVARQALAGEIHDPAAATSVVLWVAGPGASRARLLAGVAGAPELAARVAGPDARQYWTQAPAVGPDSAPATQASRPAKATPGEAGRVAAAAALLHRGAFEAAIEMLVPCRSPPARVQRARCQLLLGRLGAARATLRRLEPLPLSAAEAIEAADVAVRVFANSGEPASLPRWVERALAAAGGQTVQDLARSHLVAAEAAWDRQDPAAMDHHLDAARHALFEPEAAAAAAEPAAIAHGAATGLGGDGAAMASASLLCRWHRALALRAMAAADGVAVVGHLTDALRASRRTMARHEAGGVWNDLGIGRTQVGDLNGAERAFLHSQRLLGGCDGPRRTTLALLNLAEVRLRRGRLTGVSEILARSTAENRRGGNWRGLSQDTELWVRLELVRGRPAVAEELCRQAMERMDRRRSPWRRPILALLRARALGWLDRPAEAAESLAGVSVNALAELEPEERPALWALAGRRDLATAAAADLASPVAPLWQAVLAGEPTHAWDTLSALEPYRAARLVFDLERLAAEHTALVPDALRRLAAATLRRVGASAFADWLEARAGGPWRALAAYAEAPVGDLTAIAALLRGTASAIPPSSASAPIPPRLTWIPAGEVREAAAAAHAEGADAPYSERESAAAVVLAVDVPAGRLEVRCHGADPVLAACFALAARDLALATSNAESSFVPSTVPSTVPSAADSHPQRASYSSKPRATAFVGSSAVLAATLERLGRLATADIPVLIRGESGTGKELAAREIHGASARAGRPFLAVNCAAFAEALLLSDLFGHARGAFTGADRERAGVFESAAGGTVLLDEIGDLPLAAQGMLLRVLQEKEVRRLGESTARHVEVRVLAATHRDLRQAVLAGTFREDLFYRLQVGAVVMPPLRERGDDVLELADHFLARHAPGAGSPRLASPPGSAARPALSAAARDRLRRYRWPGNVRELENVLRLAAALADDGVVEVSHIELPAHENANAGSDADAAAGAASPAAVGSYHQQIEEFRRHLVLTAIRAAGGQHAEAARRLGISRQALSYLVRQLGLR
jgi:two-component system NtrC family response regulator